MPAPQDRPERGADDEAGRADNQSNDGDIERAPVEPDIGHRRCAPRRLGLLAVRVGAGLGLAVHAGERRGGFGALLLVLILLRLLLFLVASHLTFRHGGLRLLGG